MKHTPSLRTSVIKYALAGAAAGIGGTLTTFLFAWIAGFGSGFTGFGGFGSAISLIGYAALPFAAAYAFIALKFGKEKGALPTALLVGAGVYAIFVLLQAAEVGTVALVILAALLSAVWGVGAGLANMILRSRPASYVIALVAIVAAFTLIGLVAQPISEAAHRRADAEHAANRLAQARAFTNYVPTTRESGPRLTRTDGGIEFSATPFGVVRESAVNDDQTTSVIPPYECDVKAFTDALEGVRDATYNDKLGDGVPLCDKIGLNKDGKPVYQQDPTITGEFFYYYTRIEQTNIAIKVPLEFVIDPTADVNAVVIGIVNSLQPFSGTIEAPHY